MEFLDERIANNIDFVRRHLADTVYKLAVLEGIATTYAATEAILEGGKINNMTLVDVQKIVNIKNAWEFILNRDTITAPLDLDIISKINRHIEDGFYYNAGKVRSIPVSIGGSTYKPPLPIESVIREEIADILSDKVDTEDKAIALMLYLMKRQVFIDGNKRTAVISANHLLVSKGFGLVSIPAEKTSEFKNLLIEYYEGKDTGDIVIFIKTHCFIRL